VFFVKYFELKGINKLYFGYEDIAKKPTKYPLKIPFLILQRLIPLCTQALSGKRIFL